MSGITRFIPLPNPREFKQCACGEPLTMEMEHDAGSCVECQARTAIFNRTPLSVPTGSGKSIIGLALACSAPRTVMFLSDRCGRA